MRASEIAIKLLAGHVIPKAGFDSSDHPPGCHPGTRLDISGSILTWAHNLAREYRVLWLNGPAGVGKSAILQTIAEIEAKSGSSILGATLFFSRPKSRDDAQCVFITIAYQLSMRYRPYRNYIIELLTFDPRLIEKSLAEQFEMFIVQPFAVKKLLAGLRDTVLIILDGLDECNGEEAQRQIIFLIGKFSLEYPMSPLIWLVASRPEPHIFSAFSSKAITSSWEEMQVPVDSDQGCRDVERYLRDNFEEIRERYPQSIPSSEQQWPAEVDFSKIAARSSGLFVFPSTIIRFIGDTDYANPVSQLKIVLGVIDSTSSTGTAKNPFALLDALYTRILSEIHRDVLRTTMYLLALYTGKLVFSDSDSNMVLGVACNWFGVTQGDAYGALRKLHSVLKIPAPQKAFDSDEGALKPFHASFFDYLVTHSRSGAFYVGAPEIIQRHLLRCIHVLEACHSVEMSNVDMNRINLSWPPSSPPSQRDGSFAQHNAFYSSRDILIKVPHKYVNEPVLHEFNRLSSFFQDLDSELWILNIRVEGMCQYLTSAFRTCFEDWGVLKTIPLVSFNTEDIRLDETVLLTLVHSPDWSEETFKSDSGCEFSGGSNMNYLFFLPALHGTQFIDHQGQEIKKYSIMCLHESRPLSKNPAWMAHIQQQLATLTKISPSYSVTVFGRGRKSLAHIRFEHPDEVWFYALPCVSGTPSV
ncbi:hypothetical protein P691DRAFT_734046 [Macrolepiota fuliginosa MF-IS2]|uniref:NACHT domain-containing protein n=1 Tax=Macrolepiota fuliginosa MF-IS2 TaxID=1400762 RepID=A0A9P5XAZ8_9AGAR|nr:hypothetical protein P691DRAFT_734046 [Macrolepiota fuliginosa MF-IS2]